jgi:ATP-binding cassette subfamily B protein
MKILLKYRHLYTKHSRDYIKGLVALLVTNGLLLSIPWLIKYAIDSLREGVDARTLLEYGLAIACVATIQMLFRVQSRRLILGNSRKIDYDIKDRLLESLQRLAPSYYRRTYTGDLMSRAAHDVMLVRALGGPGVLYLANSIIVYVIALPMMAAIDPMLTVLLFLPFPIMAYFVRSMVDDLKRYSLMAQETLGSLNTVVQETLNGISVIKAFRMEKRQEERFRELSGELMSRNLDLAKTMGRMIPLVIMAGGIGAIVILYYGGKKTIEGSMSYGDFVAFFAFLWMLLRPTVALGWILSLIQRSKVGLERLDEVLSAEITIKEPANPLPIPSLPGDIEIRDLNYRYEGNNGGSSNRGREVLRGISLTIKPGEMISIVGHVGSGKSTLLRAIPRLIEVPPGSVFFNGSDITSLPLRDMRRKIGYVPQDDFLFSATIADNIEYGRPGIGIPEIEEAARLASIHEDIMSFPEGYGSIVGERGLTLSGGQRQRLALARAFLIDPPILVLDNALAHVDTETEEKILTELRRYREGRTILLATNRLAGLDLADRVVVLEGGAVSAVGSHRRLIEESQIYNEMVEQQSLTRELDEL